MAQRRLQIVLDLDTGAYTGRLANAGGQMRKFGGDVSQAGRDVDGMGRAFGKLGGHLNGPRQQLRDYVMILGNIHFAILNVQNALLGWVAGLIKQSAEVERMTVLMKGLSTATTEVGKSADARESLAALFSMARKNGVAVSDLTDSFVKLKTAGIDPINGSLQSLTNAVAFFGGTSQTMHRASIAIQQMAGKGVISMEELRQQLGEAVPTAIQDMARAMSMSMQEFTKIVSKGKVQAKPALELMFREFELLYAGSGDRMASTLNGQLATFRTNVTELSTYFTGLADGMTPGFEAHMARQKQLFDEGKITATEYAEAIKPPAGLFTNVVNGLKQVNEAMRSDEARQAVIALGQGINTLMQGVVSLVTFIVRWRSEIGFLITAMVVGFAAVKATQMASWLIGLGVSGVGALRAIGQSAGSVYPAMQGMVTATNNWSAATRQAQGNQQLAIASNRLLISQSAQSSIRLNQEIQSLRGKSAAITQQIQLITNQRNAELRSLAAAKTLHAANIAMGRDSVQSLRNVDIAQGAVNRSSASLIRLRGQQRTVTAAAAAADRALSVATNVQSAAQGRMNVMTVAGAAALRLSAAAAGLAATAVRWLGVAVNFALGPIGMLITALGMAAYQAGLFETSADRAAAAAVRLAQGIATLDDVKDLSDQRDKVRKDRMADEEALGKTGFWDVRLTPERRKFIEKRRDNSARIERELGDKLNQANSIIGVERGNSKARAVLADRDAFRRTTGNQYATDVRTNEQKYGAGTPRAIAANDKARKNARFKNQVFDDRLNENLGPLGKAHGAARQDEFLAFASNIRDATGASVDFTESQEGLRTAALGSAAGVGKTGKSAAETEKTLTAADKATKRFESTMESNIGTIAQMEDELSDGNGALAKFEAQLKNTDKYAHMSAQQIDALRETFKKIDETAAKLDFKHVFDKLAKDAKVAAREANMLWESLKSGRFVKDQRNNQIMAQYADELDAEKDPLKKLELYKKIEEISTSVAQSDAAQVLNEWENQAEDTMISLMDEDAAREANFQRDLQRMRASIDWSRLTADQKIEAERRYQNAASAMRQKADRENEGSVLKMMRQWYRLGRNMDEALAGAIENFVNNLAEGKASFADFAKEIIKSLVKVILKALIAYAIMSALGMTNGASLGDFLKGGFADFGKSLSPGGSGQKSVAEDGATFTEGAIPKMHGGGWIGMPALKPGEVPLIGQEGEVVLTREQQKIYAGGAGGSKMPEVTLNIINNSGTPLSAEQGTPRLDAKGMILDVVVEAMGKQGPFRDNLERMIKS